MENIVHNLQLQPRDEVLSKAILLKWEKEVNS